MRIFLRIISYFVMLSVISSLAMAKEPIKLHSAEDFNKQPSTMTPSAPTKPNTNQAPTNNNAAPSHTTPTQNSVPYYTPSIPNTTPAQPPSTATTSSPPTSPSSTTTNNSSGILLDSTNSSKNANAGNDSWIIH